MTRSSSASTLTRRSGASRTERPRSPRQIDAACSKGRGRRRGSASTRTLRTRRSACCGRTSGQGRRLRDPAAEAAVLQEGAVKPSSFPDDLADRRPTSSMWSACPTVRDLRKMHDARHRSRHGWASGLGAAVVEAVVLTAAGRSSWTASRPDATTTSVWTCPTAGRGGRGPACVEQVGGIDAVVTCAGIDARGRLADIPGDDWDA